MKHIKHIFFMSIILPVFFNFTLGQTSSLKLPTSTSGSDFSVLSSTGTGLFTVLGDGTVGIQQTSPNATLEIGGLNGLLVTGTYNSGTTLSLGAGIRLHWYPKKGAFRVGKATGTEWDDASIGNYSFATGYSTTASGTYSFATGGSTTASAYYSFATGGNTTASGNYSFATGYNTTASGDYSTAMGSSTTASGIYSFATGVATTASGTFSTAMGQSTTASGYYSTALGNYVSTNSKSGSFIIGDNSTSSTTSSTATNQMMMRFNGGYRLYSKTNLSTGVYMSSGVSGWTNISDRNKKENFRPLDGELLLEKISAIPITEWNYKGTDKSIKYIGPMAQDFYAAFNLGGTDSLGINSIAIDGVNMAAIQSLIKRTDELKIKNQTAVSQVEELRIAHQKLENKTAELVKLKDTAKEMQKDFNQIKKAFAIYINNTSPDVKHKLTMNK